MTKIDEMAAELGKALGQTEEYQALKRAARNADEDRELVQLRSELEKLEGELMTHLRAGQEPSEEKKEAYEGLAEDLQSRSEYQRLVAAQANFDKVLQKVNETISRGIQEGAESRIIMP